MAVVVSVVLAVVLSAASVAELGADSGSSGRQWPGRLGLTLVAPVTGGTAVAARAGDGALYVAGQEGRVMAVGLDQRGPRGGTGRVVLDLSERVVSGGEQGLLGLAFSPDGQRLYVDYTRAGDGATVVAEYAMARRRAVAASERVVLTVAQPQANHNGGQLAFGPDGALYVGLGDGGGGGDQGPGHALGGNAQSLDTLLGKILRIDPRPTGNAAYRVPVDNPYATGGGRPEIWVRGLRNPWRFSFDRRSGDLWIGDVGQNSTEEVTRLRAGEAGGANLGWNLFEGGERYRDGGGAEGLLAPQITMSHDDGACSVTGGFVYRGRRIAGLGGWYVFSDYCDGALRAVRIAGDGSVASRTLGVSLSEIASLGQDGDGELYVLSRSEGLYALTPQRTGR